MIEALFFLITRLFKQAFHKGNIQLIFNYFPLRLMYQNTNYLFFSFILQKCPCGIFSVAVSTLLSVDKEDLEGFTAPAAHQGRDSTGCFLSPKHCSFSALL